MKRARSFVWLAALLIVSTIAVAQSPSPDFTLIALPDTQNYVANNPAIFNSQTQWIVNNAAALNIQLVLHEGDIVNGGGDSTQWKAADAAMKILDGHVPYVAVIGNHDYDHADPKGRTASTVHFNEYFGPSRYANTAYYQGSYQSGSNENFYSFFTINGQPFLVMALEVYPRDAVLAWADSVLDANPDKEAIILTHSYMYADDTRVGRCDKGGKSDLSVPNDNDGEDMWNNLVRKHANVSLVLSGHIVWNQGIGRRADLGDDGNLVNEMLADYQNYSGGGDGYLRILTFHPSTNSIDVQTYSPWLGKSLTDSRNKFTLKWHADDSMAGQPSLVEGRVRGKDCSVIASASISADDATAKSDSNGIFSFTTMAASPMVQVAASGWVTQGMQLFAPQGAGAQPEFFLDPAARISGTVKNSGGLPISGATVTLTGSGDPITLTTDQNGAFLSDWIAAGSYTVSAQTSDGGSASTTVTLAAGATTTITLTIASSAPGHTLLSGSITSAIDGRVLSGATVTAGGKSDVADSSGQYSIADLSPGTYTVTASKSGWGHQSHTVTLIDGSAATVNIQLTTSGRIGGTVKKSDGSAAAGVTVTFTGGVIANTISVSTNSSGAFTSSWIPVGDYQITATDGSNSASGTANISAGELASVPLTLSSEGNPPPPPPPPPDDGKNSVTGRVISAIDGRVLAGATVSLGSLTTATNSSGVYTFADVTSGTYTIGAAKSGWGAQSMTYSVVAGANSAPDIKLATSGRISGAVKLENGSAAAGVTVTFAGGVINNTSQVVTTSTGSFISSWIPVGDYTVAAQDSAGNAVSTTVSISAGQNAIVNLTLGGSAPPPPPPPPPDGSVSVTGRIISAIDGRVLSGATVTLADKSALTDANGAYTFSGLAETTYTVTAAKSGWGHQSMSVSLGSGANTAPDLKLATSGRISGKVTSGGAALSGATISFTGGVINNTTSVTTRSDGTYISGWIPVGDYSVNANKNGTTHAGTATVSAGGTTVVNFAY